MKSYRKYGKPPYSLVLVHGGPGAVGEMRPVAQHLDSNIGIVECLNKGLTIDEQLRELKGCIAECEGDNLIIAGFSWGAWLSILFAARYPGSLSKLILISSGPLEEKYAREIYNIRMNRLDANQRKEFSSLLSALEKNAISEHDTIFKKLGTLISLSDSFDPVKDTEEDIELHPEVYFSVWSEASELRKNGQLLNDFRTITCPIVAIHGDYDPHPFEGIQLPGQHLSDNFQFELLKNCGHKPWKEKQARENFYNVMEKYLNEP